MDDSREATFLTRHHINQCDVGIRTDLGVAVLFDSTLLQDG